MKIGILTLRLHLNFGGILQAYALQTVLQRLDHEVYVVSMNEYRLHPIKAPFAWIKRSVMRYILGNKNSIVFREQEYAIMSQHTRRFIDEYINKLPCFTYSSLTENCVDAIVVGSDQVWRPKYFGEKNICDAYLNFASGWDIKRIAYATSFGTDEWEYSPKQTLLCKELASKFDAISVREDSAVRFCKDKYGVEACHVLDPTMLIEKEDYISLVENTSTSKSEGNLLVYILDISHDKQMIINKIEKHMDLSAFNASASSDWGTPIQARIQPPVEQWLRGFIDADFVVTDSFHACVFSIIFNKPFVAYGNQARGAARFHSLLRMFGLEKQYITSYKELDVDTCANIDWVLVNEKHKRLKKLGINFLNGINEI